MLRDLKYVIVATILLSVAKLLQITFNEGLEKYGENKEKFEKTLEEKVIENNYENPKTSLKNDTAIPFPETPVDSVAEKSGLTDLTHNEDQIESRPGDGPVATTREVYFQDLIHSYLKPIIGELTEGRAREDVIIRYYKHEKDGDHVYALKNLGYYLHEKEATETKGLESNVLIYGNDVDIRDIRIVAYTLLVNEVPLKSIQKSKYEWKFHALEIGTNPTWADLPTITLKDIRSFEIN